MNGSSIPSRHIPPVRLRTNRVLLLCAFLVAALLVGGCVGGPGVCDDRPRAAGGADAGNAGAGALKNGAERSGDETNGSIDSDDHSGSGSISSTPDEPAPASAQAAPATPDPIPVDPSAGVPLEELFNPYEGLRLRFTVSTDAAPTPPVAAGDPTDPATSDAPQLILIVQPSRGSRGDISVHHAGGEGWLIMEETEALWMPAAAGADDPVVAAIAQLAWPRFLPSGSTPYRAVGAGELIVRGVAPSGEEIGPYEIEYATGAHAVLREFPVEPGPLPGGGPAVISVDTAATGPIVLHLESAAIFREREIAGVVVSPQGRPLGDVAVAPHPAIGRLAPSRVALTDAFGRFVLPMRIAPGDPLRLFFGRVEGSGDARRIADPQVIRGRADSPDFATLIYTGR